MSGGVGQGPGWGKTGGAGGHTSAECSAALEDATPYNEDTQSPQMR